MLATQHPGSNPDNYVLRSKSVPLRMLVVEDDPLQRSILAGVLEGQGFYVETSEDGLDALRRGRLGWFEVVLMDCQLPEINGLSAAKLIADFACDRERPIIIALSAAPEMVDASLESSVFDAVVRKPWDLQTLTETIMRCHDRRSPERSGIPKETSPLTFEAQASPHTRETMAETAVRDDNASDDALRILIVDDDDVVRSVLAAAFSSKGFSVDTAAQGLEGLRMIRQSPYDVAILDYNLPEIDGLAIARLTHELVQGAHRPRLIALTSSPQHLNDREAGSLSAFDDVILKSSDIDAVLSSVESSLTYKRLRPKGTGVNVVALVPI